MVTHFPSRGTPALDPRPQAAFRLGYLGVTIWIWHELLWEMPWHDGIEDGAPFTIEHIHEARRNLSDQMHTNVFNELPNALREFLELNDKILTWFRTVDSDSTRSRQKVPPGSDLWIAIRQLCDRALSSESLRSLYDFGVSLGEYQLALRRQHPNQISWGDLECHPDLSGVLQEAKRIPPELLQYASSVESLVRFVPEFDRFGQSVFLEKYFLEYSESGSGGRRLHPDNPMSIRRLMTEIKDDFDEALSGVTLELCESLFQNDASRFGRQIDGEEKPVWDKERSELRFRRHVIRRVRPMARHIVAILGTFEDLRWPRRIDDPLGGPQAEQRDRLHDALASLNEHIVKPSIRFSADGTGLGIKWTVESTSPSPGHVPLTSP
jgi:hypothetical protein